MKITKQILSIFLCTTILLSVFICVPLSTSAMTIDNISVANNIPISKCNENIETKNKKNDIANTSYNTMIEDEYEKIVQDGVVYAIDEYNDLYLVGYISNELPEHLVIPKEVNGYPVEVILSDAFKGAQNLKSVFIPNTLKSRLTDYVFENCVNLENVVFENGIQIKIIGERTFAGCTSLERIYIPASVETIAYYTFDNCINLKQVIFEENSKLISIGMGAFYNCEALQSIDIPSGCKRIYDDAFMNCYSLSEVILREGLIEICEAAFLNCYNLPQIYIPKTVESIEGVAIGCVYDSDNYYSFGEFTVIGYPESLADEYAKAYSMKYALPAPTISSVKNTENGIKVSFKKISGVSGGNYRVYRKTSGKSWTKLADVTGTTYTDKTAEAGKKYTYTVKYIGKPANSIYDKTGLSITRLLSPKVTKIENTYTGPKVTWSKVAGATKYRVYVKTADGWKNKGFVTGTSYTHTSAIKGKTYSYTVRPYASDTDYGLYNSTGWSNKYIPAPEISSVTNTTSGVKVKWNKVDGAKKYRVYVKGGSATSWKKKCDTTSLSYTHTTASSGTTYTYTVRCLDASGNVISGYNPDGVTKTYYKAPKISKLSNTAQGVSLTWDKIAGATYYRVYVKVDGEYQTLTDTTDTSYLHTDVISGSTYTYTVRCISSDGTHLSTYYTDGWSKKYIAQPEIKSAENTESGVALSWDAVQGAEKYRVFVKGGSATSWKKLTDTTSLSFTHKTGKAGTTYTYTVRCISADSKSYTSSYNTEGVVVENYKLP